MLNIKSDLDTEQENQLKEKIAQSFNNINDIILGKEEQIKLILVAFFSGGHILINDNPGMGKTTIAKTVSSILNLHLKRVQFTSDLMPSDITGINVLSDFNNIKTSEHQNNFILQKGPVFTNILLADEINRAPPRTQSALLESMEEKRVSMDGKTYNLPDPFWVIATQNPVDFESTFPLPVSQKDRFLFQLSLGYPDEQNECYLYKRKNESCGHTNNSSLSNISNILSIDEINNAKKYIKNQTVSDILIKYVYKLINETRHCSDIMTGLSPRAGIALISAGKTLSWFKGKKYVTPDDIRELFVPLASHRLVISDISSQQELEKVAKYILNAVSCP